MAEFTKPNTVLYSDLKSFGHIATRSLNGTALISGASGSIATVELPRAQRGGQASPVVPIAPGDTLCLGVQTCFLVTSLTVRHGRIQGPLAF